MACGELLATFACLYTAHRSLTRILREKLNIDNAAQARSCLHAASTPTAKHTYKGISRRRPGSQQLKTNMNHCKPVHVGTYINLHISLYSCVYAHMYMYLYMCVHIMCEGIHLCTYTYVNRYVYVYIYIRTHIYVFA